MMFYNGLVVLYYDQFVVEIIMQLGMIFIIELMINLGVLDYEIWDDGWMVVIKDCKWIVQFEYILLVIDIGVEILICLQCEQV